MRLGKIIEVTFEEQEGVPAAVPVPTPSAPAVPASR
jgi:hypothetical protein